MREYETTVIVQPEISDEGVASLCERLDGVLGKGEATRLLYDDLGKRRLAYEIQNFQKGRYVMLHFLDSGKVIPDLERALRLEDSVIRYLSVQVDGSVEDVEARKTWAAEEQRIREERAAERKVREAEEAARAAAEAEEAARAAEAAEAARVAAAEAAGDEAPEADADEASSGDEKDAAPDDEPDDADRDEDDEEGRA